MKKLINAPEDVVTDALQGIEAAHPELSVDHAHKVIYRSDGPHTGKVGIISGGGSGHEPLHGGFVGLGMLDAACAGEVFTSPVPDQMLAATKLVDGGAGVLHVVKNYTGDVMNFEMAAELAAAETGAKVVSVVTDDDVAVQDSTWTAGRRGVGVTVLLEKIAGAAAEQGRPLDQVADVAKRVNANGRSMGLALTSCTVPAVGRSASRLCATCSRTSPESAGCNAPFAANSKLRSPFRSFTNTAGLKFAAGFNGTQPVPTKWPGWSTVAGNPWRRASSSR